MRIRSVYIQEEGYKIIPLKDASQPNMNFLLNKTSFFLFMTAFVKLHISKYSKFVKIYNLFIYFPI
jgi:hypothetical protein